LGGKTFAEFLKALFSYEISITDHADVVISALITALRQMAQKTLVAHK
jgi:hypothetical protein